VAGVLVVAAVLREPGPGRAALLFAAALAPLLSVVVAVAWVVKPWAVGAMIAVTLVAAWVTLGALVNRSTRAIAVTLCVALALWAGALGFLRDVAAWHPHLERAVVEPKSGPTVVGFYLGGSGGDVYVASESRPRFVTLIRKDDVGTLQFGERVAVDQQARGNQDGSKDNEGAGGTGTTGTDTSGGGADGGSGSADDAVIPVSPEAARPDPTLRRVIATAYGSVDGVPLRLQIMEPRRGTSLMVLNLRLTSRDVADEGTPRRLIVGSVFDDGVATERSDMRDTVDGLAIADLDGKHRHTVARDDDGVCLCSRGLRQVALDPGQSVRLFATFAPAPTSGTFELQVDGFGDIPLATGPS
jgi:hypothetical protein